MSFRRLRRAAFRAAVALLPSVAPACGPSPDAPLPPETALETYALAVAQQARRRVPALKAKGIFNVARVHERFGIEDEALTLYRAALEADPNLAEAYRRIGFILSQRKDRMTEAVEAYTQALNCDPTHAGVYTRLGLVYMHMNRLEDAERALQEEIRGESANEDTHYFLGQVRSLQGKHAEAATSYQEAIRLAPAMRSAHYALAQAWSALGRREEEEKALSRFRELKQKEDAPGPGQPAPKDNRAEERRFVAETWMDAADLYYEGAAAAKAAGATADARQELYQHFDHALREAIRFDPLLLEARKNLVEYHRAIGNFDRAAQSCEEALAALPGESSLALLAHELAGKVLESGEERATPAGRQETALRLLKAAAAASPRFWEAHFELAKLILFRMSGRVDLLPLALKNAQAAVELHPSGETFDILAFAYFQNGQVPTAVRTLEEGVGRFPDDPRLNERLRRFRAAEGAPETRGQGGRPPQ